MLQAVKHFFLFEQIISAKPIGNGNINDTYLLEFEEQGVRQTVLFQRLNHLVFKQPDAVSENILRVCQHISEQNFPYKIAQPLQALNGAYLHKDGAGNCWRAFSYLENTFAPEGDSDAHIAYEAARAYGAFARALSNFPANTLHETISGFHDTDRRWEVFLDVLRANPVGRVHQARPEIDALYAAKPIFDQISRLKKSGELPLRVAHNDTKAGNVLFDLFSKKAVAVIDLDTVMPGTILSDFGDMVRTFAPDHSEDATIVPSLRREVLGALQEGFLEETGSFLSPSERKHLMLGAAWITGEQALRFLSDWLAGDIYYKVNSSQHNLVRARNQLALFEAIRLEL